LIVYRRDASTSNQECQYGIKFQKLGLIDLLKFAQDHKGPAADEFIAAGPIKEE